MSRVVGVKDGGESFVLGPEPIQEVGGKDPNAVGVDRLLERQMTLGEMSLELVLGHAVEKGDFLHDLVDGGLHGRVPVQSILGRVEVDGHDAVAVGELLDVLAARREAIVVIQITHGAEEATGSALLVSQHQPDLGPVVHLEVLNDRTGAGDGFVEDVLVDLTGVFGGLLEEELLTNDVEAGFALSRVLVDKVALVDEVATELLISLAGESTSGPEGLDPEDTLILGGIQILFIDPTLVLGTLNMRDTGERSVDEDGVVSGLLFETNLEPLVITRISSNLGGVEGVDVVDDAGWRCQ